MIKIYNILLFSIILLLGCLIIRQSDYQHYQKLQLQFIDLQTQQQQAKNSEAQLIQTQLAFKQVLADMPKLHNIKLILDKIFIMAHQAQLEVSLLNTPPTIKQRNYVTVPLSFALQGSYKQLVAFINMLSQQHYFLQVVSWQLAPDDQTAGRLLLKLNLYFFGVY